MRVFISSTSEDLTPYRQAARDVVLDLGWHPVMMEHFGTDGQSGIVDACSRQVKESDLVLAIIAWRRGSVPGALSGGDGHRSFTALELDCAVQAQKPVLVLMARPTWPGNLWESDAEARSWIADFRAGLDRLAVHFDWENVEAGAPEILPIFRSKIRQELLRHREALQVGSEPPPRVVIPGPIYVNDEVRALSLALEEAYRKLEVLKSEGRETTTVQEEILSLRRHIREGGQIKAGDFLLEDRFRILEQIGRGGFATVWKAWDRKKHDLVAIKILHGQFSEDRTGRERFFRGARKMAELQHQGIVRVIEENLDDGGFHFFVMELITGGDLRRAVLEGRLDPEVALQIILKVSDSLHFAHEHGVVHRDVKPANILLDENKHPKLTDFDLVRAFDTTGGTRTGMLGTFLYTAPEVMSLPQEAGASADVYSLAMTAAFCLHGADLPPDVIRDPQDFIRKLHCSPAIKGVLRKAVSWESQYRFASVAEFAAALHSALTSLEYAFEASATERQIMAYVKHGPPGWPGTEAEKAILTALETGIQDTPDLQSRVGAAAWLIDHFPGKSLSFVRRERAANVRRAVTAQLRQPPPVIDEAEWTNVEGGSFFMGSKPGEGTPAEYPRHRVNLSPFRMMVHPVTNREYRRLVPNHPGEDQLPAVGINWYDAYAYAAWLEGRLPTEAEWEFAARAGLTFDFSSREGRETTRDRVAWYTLNSGMVRKPVQQLEPNRWGLFDLYGNVWEWTADWFAGYPEEPQTDPWGPPTGTRRVLRGGSYRDTASRVRAGYRLAVNPERSFDNVGFRVVIPSSS